MVKKLSTGPGIMIGIPTLGRPIPLDWAMSFKSLSPPINYNANTMLVYGKPVDQARNDICEEALKLGCKYLFFLGDDVVAPNPTLKQLIFRMENNPKIGVVGGIYCSKSEPAAPLVFRDNGRGSYWDWKVGEFFEVTGLGMDLTLIRVDILNRISKPWFKTIDGDKFQDGQNYAEMWTEDLYFCNKVLGETDYKIFVDSSLLAPHWDIYNNKSYTLPPDSYPMRRLNVIKDKKAVDIGCGPIDRSEQFPNYELVRVDIREDVEPDYRCDVRHLPFGNNEFDLVFSSHVLEHFPRKEFKDVLGEWIRILKKDGELMLVLPNIKWAVEHFDKKEQANNVGNVIHGGQTNEFDFHYNALWPEQMEQALKDFGLSILSMEHQGYNMIIRASRVVPKESTIVKAPGVTATSSNVDIVTCVKGHKIMRKSRKRK